MYYLSDADEYVALTAEQLAAARFVKYTHTSYLAVYDSADKATRNVVKAAGFVAGTTVYDANGNEVAEDNLFVKVKHSGIGWTKDNGISIDLVFDNPNTTKPPISASVWDLTQPLFCRAKRLKLSRTCEESGRDSS